MTRVVLFLSLACIFFSSCAVHPVGPFRPEMVPPAPDFSDYKAWAALPFQMDSADVVPDTSLKDRQDKAAVDVFFLYPTTYTGKKGQRDWNGDVTDENLNVRTDRLSIRNQATVFNGSCKVYAPRYRQAHLDCFYTRKKKEDATKALDLAYQDVRAGFKYYLTYYNEGRPLIIAAHSQGTLHAARLIKEFYGDEKNGPPLIAAYLIGMPIPKDAFTNLPPCETAEDIHCFCSWRTVHEKYRPSRVYPVGDIYAVINPLNWTSTSQIATKSMHDGAVLRKFYEGVSAGFLETWIGDGLLRVARPKIPGVPFLPIRNYHVADYNFFYANMRENVKARIAAYFSSLEGK